MGGSAYYMQKFQNLRFCLYRKTPKLDVLRCFKNIHIILNTPKSEVLLIICKNFKIGGFTSTAKTPKLEAKCSFKSNYNNIKYSKIRGSA